MYAWRINLYLLYTIDAYGNISICKYVYIYFCLYTFIYFLGFIYPAELPYLFRYCKAVPVNLELPGGNVTVDGSIQKQAK